MNKRQAENYRRTVNRLCEVGFGLSDIESLFKIERTLHRWGEMECGDSNDCKSWAIERDEKTGVPYMVEHMHVEARPGGSMYGNHGTYRTRVADREAGALRRLNAIVPPPGAAETSPAFAYHQGDPRGCALYIIPKDRIPMCEKMTEKTLIAWLAANYSSSGIAVCI